MKIRLEEAELFHADGQTDMTNYTRCPRRSVPDFGRVFLMLNYTDITQNRYDELYINYQLGALIIFIHKILFSSTCFEPQVLIFRRIQCIHAAYGTVTLYKSSWWPVDTQLE